MQSNWAGDSETGPRRSWDSSENGPRRSSFDGSSPSARGKNVLHTADSLVSGSSLILPTVEEEAGPRKVTQEALPLAVDNHMGEPAAEMAVRRGKNRFMNGRS